MPKMTRLTAAAAVLLIAVASAVIPQAVRRSTTPGAAAPAAAAAPRERLRPRPRQRLPLAHARPKSSRQPYGLEALWKGGDIVAKVTLAILAIMSMGSWYIITKVYEQAKMARQARAPKRPSGLRRRCGKGRTA